MQTHLLSNHHWWSMGQTFGSCFQEIPAKQSSLFK